jgi:hypothetical protein
LKEERHKSGFLGDHRAMAKPVRLATVLASAILTTGILSGLPAPAGAGDRASIQLHATVLARASMDAQRLPQRLVISEEDLERGYVELGQPVEVDFRTNHPGGVVLGFVLDSRQIAAVEAQAFEGGMPLASGATIFVPQRERGFRARTVSLKLRLKLAPGAAPGTVAFPVSVSLAPA